MRVTCVLENTASGWGMWGEHGLSFLVETGQGNVLWDTGQSGTVLANNLRALGLDDTTLSAVALSHGHGDHTGGLGVVLERQPDVPIYAHRDLFMERLSERDGQRHNVGMREPDAWRQRGSFVLDAEPREIVPGVWTTGTITPRPHPVGGSTHLKMRVGGTVQGDAYLDDMSLVLEVAGGLVLVCGCCHAGLRNTMELVARRFDGALLAVMGGSHLASVGDGEIGAVAQALEEADVRDVYLNHCTGHRALFLLRCALGERAHSCPGGTVLEFA